MCNTIKYKPTDLKNYYEIVVVGLVIGTATKIRPGEPEFTKFEFIANDTGIKLGAPTKAARRQMKTLKLHILDTIATKLAAQKGELK